MQGLLPSCRAPPPPLCAGSGVEYDTDTEYLAMPLPVCSVLPEYSAAEICRSSETYLIEDAAMEESFGSVHGTHQVRAAG